MDISEAVELEGPEEDNLGGNLMPRKKRTRNRTRTRKMQQGGKAQTVAQAANPQKYDSVTGEYGTQQMKRGGKAGKRATKRKGVRKMRHGGSHNRSMVDPFGMQGYTRPGQGGRDPGDYDCCFHQGLCNEMEDDLGIPFSCNRPWGQNGPCVCMPMTQGPGKGPGPKGPGFRSGGRVRKRSRRVR